MNGSVRGLGVMVFALGFAACAGGTGAGGGKVSPKRSLVGVWEGIPGVDPRSPKDTTGKTPLTHGLMISADSTYAEVVMQRNQAGCGGGRWALSGGDSVTWFQQGARAVNHKIVFKNQQFWLYMRKDTTKPVEAYRLADTTATPKPKHLASLSQCSTAIRQAIKAAAAKAAKPATPAPKKP